MIATRKKYVLQARRLDIGSRIRAARLKKDMTPQEAARALGISVAYLGFLERSRPDYLSDELLIKLVAKLEVPKTPLKRLQSQHNALACGYYRAYRQHRLKVA